jgi:IS4 transposase
VPAELIALIYRRRWTIEIFFRFFKHTPTGVAIQAYCAIIACLLLNRWTGGRATLNDDSSQSTGRTGLGTVRQSPITVISNRP